MVYDSFISLRKLAACPVSRDETRCARSFKMTQMMYEIYDALNSIGVDEDKATQVAKGLGEPH